MFVIAPRYVIEVPVADPCRDSLDFGFTAVFQCLGWIAHFFGKAQKGVVSGESRPWAAEFSTDLSTEIVDIAVPAESAAAAFGVRRYRRFCYFLDAGPIWPAAR